MTGSNIPSQTRRGLTEDKGKRFSTFENKKGRGGQASRYEHVQR